MQKSVFHSSSVAAVALAALGGCACAQTWAEIGDAGQNGVGAAQQTLGIGALTTITGRVSGVNDVDIYCIRITDESVFHARTVAFPSVDSMMWLFNPDGTLQVGNDDVGGLFAYIGSQGVFTNGVYYLGFSSFNNQALNAANTGLTNYDTWPGTFPGQWRGNGTVLTHWNNNGSYFGAYEIELAGAEFFAVPSPAPGRCWAWVVWRRSAAAGAQRGDSLMTPPPIPPWEGMHPILVHFPVALLMVVPVFVLLGLALRKGAGFSAAALILMALGTLGAVLAVMSGEAAEEASAVPGAAEAVFERHEELGELARTLFLVLTPVYAITLAVPVAIRSSLRRKVGLVSGLVFLVLYIGGLLVLANAAHEGGRLVHEFGVRSPVGLEGAPANQPQMTEHEDSD